MGKATLSASATSLGTGSYNLNNEVATIEFCYAGANGTASKAFTVLSPSCPHRNCLGIDSGQSSSLGIAISTLFDERSYQEPLHPTHTKKESTSPTWSGESVKETADLWGLSNTFRNDLMQLGHHLQDLGKNTKNNPADAVRFLIANNGNVSKAEKGFREMILWRKQNNVDNILHSYNPPEKLVNHYPGAVLRGVDHAGDPIFLSRLGVTDAAGMLKQFGRSEMINHAIWLRELLCTGKWMQEYQRVHNKPVKQALVIEDVHEIQLLQIVCNRPLLSVYAEIMRLDQDNYPEVAKKIIILRAPVLFHIVWNVVQHFFDANVRAKMIFTTQSNYVEVLSQYMDVSILPPCVIPSVGKGGALDGMPSNFEGGRLPVTGR